MQIGEGSHADAAPDVRHAALRLEEVTFSAHHAVEKDTEGPFSAPEWRRGRREQWPVCFTRNTRVTLTARFTVTSAPSATEQVAVRGRFPAGRTTLEWTGSVQVAPGDRSVTTAAMVSSVALPDYVTAFLSGTITWEAQPPGEAWGSAGASTNAWYLVLADPAGTPPYWTLLHISCVAADGATTEEQLVERAWRPFTSRQLTRRRDGRGLTYWNPDTTTATNTRELLARSDGSGQCGSWSEFLVDMFKAHGVASAEKVLVVRTVPEWQASGVGFLVKHWTFVGRGSLPAPYTHRMYTECREEPGIPGQRSPNPPPAFYNHFIVRCFNKYYDPSYGGGPVDTQLQWESGAIDGLFRADAAGYPKARHATTALLEFWSLTTRTRL